ncbi:HAD family hydrolase [Streptomyces sp. TLI_185]|uniref:HAD family hydrolase n=1 Tax=Streptomyces sp. TLI_185 TaxID=2485151 RepID=UPI001609CA6A|nr:HAD-IA family hydrolase [Streptomyces sp. TLI_185]
MLRALRERGLPVAIVSNFAWDLSTHLAHHGLDTLTAACVISYERGREEPDPQLFLKACADLGTAPRATLMVGDIPIYDAGAAACGLHTCNPGGGTPRRRARPDGHAAARGLTVVVRGAARRETDSAHMRPGSRAGCRNRAGRGGAVCRLVQSRDQ